MENSPVKNGYPNGDMNGTENGDVEMVENDTPTTPKSVTKTPEKVQVQEKLAFLPMHVVKEKEGLVAKQPEKTEEVMPGGSLAVLLTQGLMANDAPKVDSVLKDSNLDSIRKTLQDLNVVHVVPLLRAIEHRLRTRNAVDIRPWIRWLQCTLSHHMSFLSSQRNLEKELGGLLEWMKTRSLHMQQLFELHGKIGVLVEQMERRTNNVVPLAPQPLIIFNNDELNDDSDGDDLGSIGDDESGASSEEDWWDEGGIRQEDDGEEEEDSDDEDDDEELEDIGGGSKSAVVESEDDDDEDDDDEEMEED